MNTMTQTVEQVEALENAGITVVVSKATDIAGVYTAINMIGALTGKVSEANSVVGQMKSVFSEISGKVPVNTGKTVYFEVSPLAYGLWTAGSGTFMNELAGMLGLKNAFADLDGWAEISQEQVIKRNPDYIVTITMYSGSGVSPVDEIKARDGWQNISAVKNNAILNADSNSISRPGPRLADALKTMYSFIYGNT
jgi:iron complex transport system substrate-binding protein